MTNRKKQIQALQERAQQLSSDIDDLVTELQEAYDNLPENLQDGERGEAMQDRISSLEEWRDQLTEMAEAEL